MQSHPSRNTLIIEHCAIISLRFAGLCTTQSQCSSSSFDLQNCPISLLPNQNSALCSIKAQASTLILSYIISQSPGLIFFRELHKRNKKISIPQLRSFNSINVQWSCSVHPKLHISYSQGSDLTLDFLSCTIAQSLSLFVSLLPNSSSVSGSSCNVLY